MDSSRKEIDSSWPVVLHSLDEKTTARHQGGILRNVIHSKKVRLKSNDG